MYLTCLTQVQRQEVARGAPTYCTVLEPAVLVNTGVTLIVQHFVEQRSIYTGKSKEDRETFARRMKAKNINA